MQLNKQMLQNSDNHFLCSILSHKKSTKTATYYICLQVPMEIGYITFGERMKYRTSC